jgi:DNA-binding NarL/FixJ family response regulator
MAGKILALITDLFFAAKMEETAKHLGVPLVTVGSADLLLTETKKEIPSLVIIDLNFDAVKSTEVIKAVKQTCNPNRVRVLAFLSHVQTELAESAQRAGADAVVPRSYFSRNLPEILRGNF